MFPRLLIVLFLLATAASAETRGEEELKESRASDAPKLERIISPEAEELVLELSQNKALRDESYKALAEQIMGGFQRYDSENPIKYEPVDGISGDDPGLEVNQAMFTLDRVSLVTGYNDIWEYQDCSPPAPCELPDFFDSKSDGVYVQWHLQGAGTVGNVYDYVFGVGNKEVRMYLNGQLLTQAANAASPGGFHAYVTGTGCGLNNNEPCVFTVFHKDAWYPAKPPWPSWNIVFELWETQPLAVPIAQIDQWGNVTTITSAPVKQGTRSGTVVPKPTLQSFWAITIGQSIVSDRCTTCHTMDTPEKIEERHNGIVSASSVVAEPSILVPGEEVLHCNNCHEQQFSYLGPGSSFPENVWATPTPELNINWLQLLNDNPQNGLSVICNRMTTTMPTHAVREQHFHEDARLFWAVAKGELPLGHASLSTAPPHVYSEFIRRFDVWNDSGAYCP